LKNKSWKIKVLFVSYFAPPAGGVPIRRLMAILKHLPEHGIGEILLTSKAPRYFIQDEDEKIPEGVIAFGVKEIFSKIRDKEIKAGEKKPLEIKEHLLIKFLKYIYNLIRYPDPQWLWIINAVREGIKIVREQSPGAIIATQPPTTNLIVGYLISLFSSIPLILDYRDFWAGEPYIRRSNPFQRLLDKFLEKTIIDRASSIWCVTVPMKRLLIKRFPSNRGKFMYIPNGYDEDDFKGIKRTRGDDGKIIFIHTGPITTVRDPKCLLNALRNVKEGRYTEKKIEFHQFGFIHPKFSGLANEFKDIMFVHDYINYKKVLNEVANADVGICIAGRFSSDVVGFPHKAYEYLRAGIGVLAIAPDNENYRWMRENNLGWQAEPDDFTGIKNAIIKAIIEKSTVDTKLISQFEWKKLSWLASLSIIDVCKNSI